MPAYQAFYPLSTVLSSQVSFNILDFVQEAIPGSAFYTHGTMTAKPEESDPLWVPSQERVGLIA